MFGDEVIFQGFIRGTNLEEMSGGGWRFTSFILCKFRAFGSLSQAEV